MFLYISSHFAVSLIIIQSISLLGAGTLSSALISRYPTSHRVMIT